MLSTAVINGKSTLMYVSFEVNITSRVYYILLILHSLATQNLHINNNVVSFSFICKI